MSESWVRRVKQERRESGKVAAKTTRNRTPQWAAYQQDIKRLIAEQPDMTLQELKEALKTELSRQTLCSALKKLKLTLKKVLMASEQDRPDVVMHRAKWKVWQVGLDPNGSFFSMKPGPKRT